MQYSSLPHVNEAVIGLIACMRRNPYAPLSRVEVGTMSVGDVIEEIRFRFGDRAAKSVKIPVHDVAIPTKADEALANGVYS